MKGSRPNRLSAALKVTFVGMTLAFLFAQVPSAPAAQTKPSLSPKQMLLLGERMYREGILPSGKPMQAFVNGDVPVSGTAFTCLSCHLRSGLGSVEGTVVTPATNGNTLYQPRTLLLKGFESVPRLAKYAEALHPRPAYNDETLAAAIAAGVDPTGRELDNVMPRYELDAADMAILIYYLKHLSAEPSPGVSKTTLRFATVITGEVPPRTTRPCWDPSNITSP